MIKGMLALGIAATFAATACDRGSTGGTPAAPPASAAAVPAVPGQGCAKDMDCKGNRVCQAGQCVEPSGASALAPAASAVAGDPDSAATADQRRQWWIAGPLTGKDNSAAAMKGARISGTGPYNIHIDNQMGFTCALEFDADGRPTRLSACNAPNGYHFKNDSTALHCTVNPQAKAEVCSGSTGGLADGRSPNDYGFDGLAIARRLQGQAGAEKEPARAGGQAVGPAPAKTFPCNGARCRADQICCPGGPPGSGSCMAYDPSSPMFCRDTWQMCDPATHEPCVSPQRCKPGTSGRNPMCSP